MIDLHFHWVWLLMAVILIIGICVFVNFSKDDSGGIGAGISTAVGCFVLIVAILVCLVIGGIWLW